MSGLFSELQAPLLAHLLGTTLLATLLWSLHARLRRHEFNRWWASAWTLTALFQAGYSTRLRPELVLPQLFVMLATTVVGFLVIPTLVFGAVSFRSPGRITKSWTIGILGATMALALICYFVSLQWVDDTLTRLSIQNAPRTLALTGALLFSASIFLQRAASTGSGAAMLTGVCCFAYAGIQGIYTASFAMHFLGIHSGDLGGLMLQLMATLMPLNIVMTFGICLGQVLLVVDEHQRAERALVESLRHERRVIEENTALQSEIRRRQQIEEELRSSKEKFAVAFRSSPCGMAITTLPEGRFIDANTTFEALSGYTRAEVLGRTGLELGLWNNPAERPAVMEELATTGRLRSREVALLHRNGAIVMLEVSAEVVSVGGHRCLLWAALDVTDRKRAELRARELQEELMHTSRVMALGTLTGSLAHEINQPLTAIAANAHVAITALNAGTPDAGEIRAALRDIVRDNRRIDEVLRRLRLLLRKDRREYAPVDLNAIVNDVLGLVRSDLIQRRIRVDVTPGSHLPSVLGDRIQLQQVVLNIVMNAADAVSEEKPDERYMKVSTATKDGQVVVSVSDRGAGVTDAAFDQLFTPFFTTKPDGMGLGLSIARTIMDAHGGQIDVTRNADRGLTCWFAIDSATVATHAGVLDGVTS